MAPTHWRQPPGTTSPLSIYNSLTKSKVPFIPKHPNRITWYNCGPTVYDASHMGHARNYVTQDILRRIARDYFGYQVNFVMNVTDIDDKIIQRARQQHLLDNLRTELSTLTQELVGQVRQSLEAYQRNTTSKLLGDQSADIEQLLQKAAREPGWKAEMVAREEKFGMWIDAMAASHSALTRAIGALDQPTENSQSEAHRLVDGASEVLSKWLDQQHGSTVVDHAIFKKLAAYWERSFFDDMASLGVEPPSVLTRVSDYVPQIVEYVQKIVARGFAYAHEGSVYFDVNAFDGAEVNGGEFCHSYAKLQPGSKANKKLLDEGEGALAAADGKRSPADFALWKKSKPGEPAWESLWGPGRPGWHIECSVMASAVLGDAMDIHSGGVDLMFPHHDNEMAQSEAYHNCPQWVNYFIHTGHLHIEGLKMSKSLKNFITIGDALKQHSARHLRLSFVGQRWDLGMDFAESAMAEVRHQEATFNNFFAVVKALRYERSAEQMIQAIDLGASVAASHPLSATARSDFHAALCDSFNTPEAMKHLLTLVAETNKFISAEIGALRVQPDGHSLRVVSAIAAWVSKMLRVFGLAEPGPPATGDLIGWNVCDPAEPQAMEHWIQWSSFRDRARKAAREHMLKKPADPAALTEALSALCQQQFEAHLRLLNLSPSDHADSASFFGGQDLHVDHLSEPLRSTLAGHLPIWHAFWTALAELSRPDAMPTAGEVLKACDQLRDERLVEVGVALDDQDDGKALKILRGKTPPEALFAADPAFARFDPNGVPTHAAPAGEELAKSRRKKLLKEWESQKKLHAEYLAPQNYHPLLRPGLLIPSQYILLLPNHAAYTPRPSLHNGHETYLSSAPAGFRPIPCSHENLGSRAGAGSLMPSRGLSVPPPRFPAGPRQLGAGSGWPTPPKTARLPALRSHSGASHN
ncbi:hypothetical protein PtA15_17A26 [Puccinia triticina]|uniref:cysteine--tRNA ligase n=1 Tax=Puccinia triticina TaxID=208348 RepID=A0ABY7D5N0_9BASI|nr:uncharacterized protein PtA15_17A26 [Puccinia triticina]WAQ92545.1 hypothetical protein PtA15_17A26 [Puccinia triticina]